LSPYFAHGFDNGIIKYENENVYVALVQGTIETEQELVKLLEFAKQTQRPILIVAEEYSSEALTCLVVNKLKLNLRIVAIKAPMLQGFEVIEDL